MIETKAMKKERRKAEAAQRISIKWFAEKMLAKLVLRNKKLSKTVHPGMPRGALLGKKKDREIWYYYKRMIGESKELQGALKRHDIHCNKITCDAVINEACDVANFAAAIAEKAIEDTR